MKRQHFDTTVRKLTVAERDVSSDVGYLAQSFRQLEHALERRLRAHFGSGAETEVPQDSRDVVAVPDDSPFGRFVRESARDDDSRMLILLALAPWLKPEFFDRILQKVAPGASDHPELGGVRGRQHRGFIPTGDTALFILAGDDLAARARWQTLLCGDHPLVQKAVVYLEEAPDGDPPMSGRLVLDSEHAEFHALHAKLLGLTKGDKRAQVRALETALRLNPKDVDSTILLAETFQSLGMHARASRLWHVVHNLAPNHPIFSPVATTGKKGKNNEKPGLGEQFNSLVANAKEAINRILKRG